MTDINVACPSYSGISDDEVRERCAADALTRAGHRVFVACLRHISAIDVVRAELATAIRVAPAPIALLLDDDMRLDGESVALMLAAVESGCDIVTAAYRMRSAGHHFACSIVEGKPKTQGGSRLMETTWTGLGAVMLRRSVIEHLHEAHPELQYHSLFSPGVMSCGLFNSAIVTARDVDPNAPPGVRWHIADDRAFCMRARAAGFVIHAAIDARTDHRGMLGCLATDELQVKA